MKKQINLFILALLVSVLFACQSNTRSGSDAADKVAGTINIDGSSTVYPITEAIAEEFRSEAPDVRVTIGVSGTGGGFKKFARGETMISDASRSIKDSEAAACRENGIAYIELAVAYDGLAVVANPKNDWVDKLTTAELKKFGVRMLHRPTRPI